MKKVFTMLLVFLMVMSCFSNVNVQAESDISLKIGDYIEFGKYLDTPITWRVIDNNSDGILLISDKILCLKAFCAQSPNNKYGSSEFSESTLRTWLNSDAYSIDYAELSEYVPNKRNVEYNAYVGEEGFLHYFTSHEKNLINEITLDNLRTKVFMLSQNELDQYLSKSLFNQGYAYPTPEAVKNSEYVVKDTEYCDYWIREKFDAGVYIMRGRKEGSTTRQPKNGRIGVRPALYLSVTSDDISSGSGSEVSPYIIDRKDVKTPSNKEKKSKIMLRFDKKEVALNVNEIIQLKVKGASKNDKITWKSSDKLIAIVDNLGNVKGIRPGIAKIYASCRGSKVFCYVEVKEN
ncbi:DUF6273 domain-containing protein [Anaeromicropila herbilytica]|uniref:BIG2 domain-containing protein n=1 Tax=Anaeromicropila herbilytica TaxID=2785025 RepID=A0A7R7EMZ6_9FIRM|nr:DUF6273 domain-containing protein [Anaeromicropila herbilytica]BCN31809.1 hypothetical protein bsdtb5_31040 [Anaeromicropila herbilytica]